MGYDDFLSLMDESAKDAPNKPVVFLMGKNGELEEIYCVQISEFVDGTGDVLAILSEEQYNSQTDDKKI